MKQFLKSSTAHTISLTTWLGSADEALTEVISLAWFENM